MVISPLFTLAVLLGAAFLLPLFDKVNRTLSKAVLYAALLWSIIPAGLWLIHLTGGGETGHIFTAGFKPPFSISLRMGLEEAFLTTLMNLTGLSGALYLHHKLAREKIYALMLYLTFIAGANGMVLTGDLFNLFVFIEITSIALYGLLGISNNKDSAQAAFKYLIAGGMASVFLLLGIVYLYRITGTLSIDMMVKPVHTALKGSTTGAGIASGLAVPAVFLIIISLLIELKPWPANGWALDVYQTAHSGIGALISSVGATAFFYAFYKLLPLFPRTSLFGTILPVAGLVTFAMMGLGGIKQTNLKRMLGYSSAGQIGLALAVTLLMADLYSGLNALITIGGILITHFLAKAGLFWLAGMKEHEEISRWKGIIQHPLMKIMAGTFIFALLAMPPFPAFWIKWRLVQHLSASGQYLHLFLLAAGSILETYYLGRWFILCCRKEEHREQTQAFKTPIVQLIAPGLFLLLLWTAGLGCAIFYADIPYIQMIPLAAAFLLLLLDFLPAKIKALAAAALAAGYVFYYFTGFQGIRQFFALIFLGGGIVILLALLYLKGRQSGLFPLLIMLIMALANLTITAKPLHFFLAWEIMAVSSYLLVMRGKTNHKTALTYLLFSMAGAFLMMIGFAFSTGAAGLVLLLIAFLIKSAVLGVHIWLPGIYADTEDGVSAFFSAVLSKAGILGLIIIGTGIFASVNSNFTGSILDPIYLMGWIGVVTAVIGALLAVFQEDIKYLLAYSSMSQLGYIILCVAIASHVGWVTALYQTFLHFLVKAMLFLAVAGIIQRTGVRKMYRMGGLIKKMPITFLSVLMAIIALSGVPPLAGFGGKWLLYTALLEKGWYLQTAAVSFAGSVAFLYLFRLIHCMFLGQPKPEHKNLKEASVFLLIPQVLLMGLLMAVSYFPNLLIGPLMRWVAPYYNPALEWDKYRVISTLGYWNGFWVMTISGTVFVLVTLWLIIIMRRPKSVGQFNIVYAAERPYKPNTTHFAHNFFAPYRKALGFLTAPMATRFWVWIGEAVEAVSASFCRLYTGNGQTYALHILLYMIVLYLLTGVSL